MKASGPPEALESDGASLDSSGRKLLGVVLAGGESRRFGPDKALFRLCGRPLAAWSLGALEPLFSRPVVVANDPGIADAVGVEVRGDRLPGLGPLGGLLTALEWASEQGRDGVFLLATDLPLVESSLIRKILGFWPAQAQAVVPGSGGPLGIEPLCAAYGGGGLSAVKEATEGGSRAMERVLGAVGAFRIPPRELGDAQTLERAFTNVNTLEDARRVEEILIREGYLCTEGPIGGGEEA